MTFRLGAALVASVLLATGCSQNDTSQPASDASTNDANHANDAGATFASGCRILVDADPDFICTSYIATTAESLSAFNQACRESPDSIVVSACPTDPVGCCLQTAGSDVSSSCYYRCVSAYDSALCIAGKGQWTLLDGSAQCPSDAGGD
jgi:hypothetical protein